MGPRAEDNCPRGAIEPRTRNPAGERLHKTPSYRAISAPHHGDQRHLHKWPGNLARLLILVLARGGSQARCDDLLYCGSGQCSRFRVQWRANA